MQKTNKIQKNEIVINEVLKVGKVSKDTLGYLCNKSSEKDRPLYRL